MRKLLVVGLVTVFCVTHASGSLITWRVESTIVAVIDPDAVFGGAIEVGMPFVAEFDFSSNSKDQRPDDPTDAVYDAVFGVRGELGPLSFETTPGRSGLILVLNDSPLCINGNCDSYNMYQTATFPVGDFDVFLGLVDWDHLALDSDAMLATPPEVEPFELYRLRVLLDNGGQVIGNITSITPEPTALVLLGFGATLAIRRPSKS